MTFFSDDSHSVIQHFSWCNPHVDEPNFKIGPALRWGLEEMTSWGPFQLKFFYDSLREAVIIPMIKMLGPWKTMEHSL